MYTGDSIEDILLNHLERANRSYKYIPNTEDDESYNIALEDYKIFLTEVDDNISSLTFANIELLEVYDSIQNSQVSPGDFKTAIRHVTEDKNIDFHSVRLAAKATYGRIKTSIANTEKLGEIIDEELQKLYSGVDTFVQDLTEDNQILMVKAWSEYVASISKAAKVTILLYTIRIKDGITAMRKYYNLLEQI